MLGYDPDKFNIWGVLKPSLESGAMSPVATYTVIQPWAVLLILWGQSVILISVLEFLCFEAEMHYCLSVAENMMEPCVRFICPFVKREVRLHDLYSAPQSN